MKRTISPLMCAAAIAVCVASCGSRGTQRQSRAADPAPAIYGYKIVAAYPHDPVAYTQGLFWHEGALIESTGEYGRSSLRRVEPETGEVAQKTNLDARFFAEGAALVGGNIYQLTWQEGTAFVYDARTLERTAEFAYRNEGWGLATDGTKLYMSDGTANITVRDPATFAAERTFTVRNAGRPVGLINEMEWIDGRLWANVYTTEQVVIIDPEDGRVEGIVDFSGISSQIELTPSTDVMNGIACDPATGRIFVTGKNWNKLFEVEIFKR